MVLESIEQLEAQLSTLRDKRAQAKQRLDGLRAGAGRGRGREGGPIVSGRGFGVGGSAPGADRPRGGGVFSRLFSGGAPSDGAPLSGNGAARGFSFARLGGGSATGEGGRVGDRQAGRDQESRGERPPVASRLGSRIVTAPDGDAQALETVSSTGRKRLLSAVVVDGEARIPGATPGSPERAATLSAPPPPNPRRSRSPPPAEPAPERPTVPTDDRTAKRARRMFGALMGTLQKFQSEDAEFRASATAQRREEMKRRADERAAAAEAEAAAAREAAAAARRGEREAQLAELGQLALQAQVKQLELACAKRLARRQKLLAFCVTAAQPPLYWAPREPCDETAAASTAAAAAFDAWRTEQLQQLEEEKAALEQRAAEKRAAAVARGGRATAVAAAAGDGEADAPGSDGEESGSEEACLGVDEQPHDAADGKEQRLEEAEVAAAAAAAEERRARRRERRRHRGDEDDEERLLSSEDDDDDDDDDGDDEMHGGEDGSGGAGELHEPGAAAAAAAEASDADGGCSE